jgi:hypothetical protein
LLIGRQHGGEQRAVLDIREYCATHQKNAIDSAMECCPCHTDLAAAAVRAKTSCPTIRRPQELGWPDGGEPGSAQDFCLRTEEKRARTSPARAALTSSAAQGWSVRSPHIEEDYREDG